MTKRCLRCGAARVAQGHHVLGRGADGNYVSPEILAALCSPDCHQVGIHQLLAKAGIDGPLEPTPGVLVGRIGCFLGWLAWPHHGELVVPDLIEVPGSLLVEIADVLARISRELLTRDHVAR